MDVVGSEIGQKMRSAIKAKLTELGCYVDDELPDYVMVMVANKRTRTQMEDDLQLFLADNTTLFVNWLHQVLKKLQEVTVTTPISSLERESNKEVPVTKEKKSKDKKDKSKKSDTGKKSKKKDKNKGKHRTKEEKKLHKSKKKSKHHEMIRPNVPPLLMNMEKESEPSITDVFAGQILKSHGITLESLKDEPKIPEVKPILKEVIPSEKEVKRPILPIIDPSTISSQPEPDTVSISTDKSDKPSDHVASNEEQLKEINEIEAKIQGLKQKLAEQLDSMSEDEDFLNIRTEAEELMNDFAEDVFQEISQQAPVETPTKNKSPTPPPVRSPQKSIDITMETLPQIELNLPKRPIRERLGVREEVKKPAEEKRKEPEKRIESPERFTPERELEPPVQSKSIRSRLSDLPDKHKNSSDDSSDKSDTTSKRLTSRVLVQERPSRSCASVVCVRPRPRVSAPASSLLLRAVADAHKSLLNTPPKVETEPPKVKRALVRPMRRGGDHNIVIQVPTGPIVNEPDNVTREDNIEEDKSSKINSETEREEYIPGSITRKINNTAYVPSRRDRRSGSWKDDTPVLTAINIHNPSSNKDKSTQFIVTMDGFNPNAFLAKKLLTEGLLDDEDEILDKPANTTSTAAAKEKVSEKADSTEKAEKPSLVKKRLSNESEDSETKVIIKAEKQSDTENDYKEKIVENVEKVVEKRKVDSPTKTTEKAPVFKKRKMSPIVFDVDKKRKESPPAKERQRTESIGSDSHVIVTTATNSHKYDTLPPLSTAMVAERKQVWCRSFPLCRYGAACVFQHPRCKFAAACTRRNCPYSHAAITAAPTLSSHVIPSANYKSIRTTPIPSLCKFYPSCTKAGCPFHHPRPCHYGAACLNKAECNFYHAEYAANWRYPA